MQFTSMESALAAFQDRVSGLQMTGPLRFPIVELRDRTHPFYEPWSVESGVYFFESGGLIQYIGRALPGTGLRARVHNQCTSFDDPKWDVVILDESATVSVVVMPREEWYWAAALEAFLIAVFHPPYNKRSS